MGLCSLFSLQKQYFLLSFSLKPNIFFGTPYFFRDTIFLRNPIPIFFSKPNIFIIWRFLSMVTTRWRQRSRTSKGCFERSTRPMPVGTGYYTCFFWWHSFARLQDVSNVSSSAPVQGRALKAEEYLMPVAQVWKNLKHRDGTIYLTYRTLKNFSWVFYWQRLNVLEWYRMSQPNCIVLLSENGNGNARHQMSTN